MKNKFLILFTLLLPLLPYSQTVIQDTVHLEVQNKKWVEVFKITLDNGEVTTRVKPVGDTSQVIPYFVKRHADLSDSYVDLIKRSILTLNNSYNQIYKDNSVLQLGGFSPLMTILTQTYQERYVGSWRFRTEDFQVQQVLITKKNDRVILTLKEKDYQVLLFSDKHFRLLDYPKKGDMIDLFQIQNDVFLDWSQTFVLFK